MIPLRDTVPSTTVPVVNLALIALNVACFFYQVSLGQHLGQQFVIQHGFIPARMFRQLSHGEPVIATLAPILTSMFLHGGLMHLVGNMLYLYIFGDNVEDRVGHVRYLVFYLSSGFAAAIAQLAGDPTSMLPMIGASGAIAGVTGAYLRFFPTARVVTLVPVFFVLTTIRIPAFLVLIPWFLVQIQGGLASLAQHGSRGGVAFWAHVGGFVLGVLVAPLLRRTHARGEPVRSDWGSWS